MVIANRRKSAQNTLFIYVVFWACYLPQLVILIAQLFAQARQCTAVHEFIVVSSILDLQSTELLPQPRHLLLEDETHSMYYNEHLAKHREVAWLKAITRDVLHRIFIYWCKMTNLSKHI